MCRAPPATGEAANIGPHAAALGGRRLFVEESSRGKGLVVDDPDVVESLTLGLEALGYATATAASDRLYGREPRLCDAGGLS